LKNQVNRSFSEMQNLKSLQKNKNFSIFKTTHVF
jgi:hypothetical protein